MRKTYAINQTRNNAVANTGYKWSHVFHLNRGNTMELKLGKLIRGSAYCGVDFN